MFIPKFSQDLKTTWRSGTSSTLVGDKVIDVEIGRIGPGIILLSEESVLNCFQENGNSKGWIIILPGRKIRMQNYVYEVCSL
jgi:hypothetical protein